VDDLVQEILLAVVQNLPCFCQSGRIGAFRGCLRSIAHNRACDFWKARDRQAHTAGGSGVAGRRAQQPISLAIRRFRITATRETCP
jgi:DNA-directed RNA polymerase specialized sigma24 family protein